MPSYTLGDIMSFATQNAGRRSDISQSIVSRFANEAYFDVYYASDPQEGEKIAVSSTTTGENKLELPTDFWQPISLALIYSTSTSSSDYSSYSTLRLISVEEMDAKNPQPSGVPEAVAFYNSWLELWPSPNSAYSLQFRYRASPSDMTATTAVPSLDTSWRQAIVIKTEEKIHVYLGDTQSAEAASMRFLREVNRLRSDRERRQRGEFRQYLAPSWGEGGRRKV